MKSALEISFIACVFAFAGGCSSADSGADAEAPTNPNPPASASAPVASPDSANSDSANSDTASSESPVSTLTTALLSRSRRAPQPPPASINPCAAASCLTGTTCEVVGGKAVCTPNEPPAASGRFCGGFAGIACPGLGSCVDDPSDGCDPKRGGADCGGLCECKALAKCREGSVFDSSPDVCACVAPEPDACAAVRCRRGTRCEVEDTGATCVPIEQTNPCAAASCLAGTTCEVVDGKAVCTPNEPSGPFCGGIAAIQCPGGGNCVDNPNDSCDPAGGGADCGGVCSCIERVLCIRGAVFNSSPEVCACVPQEPEPDACASVRCRAGTHCEVVDTRATCTPDEPPNPCAAVLCPAPSTCDVVNGEAVCTPIAPQGPFCGGIAGFACPGAGSCVDNPNDGCDPARGGADCGGSCECNIRALCIQGSVFDPSPEVCACVPAAGGSGRECSAAAAE